MSSHEQFKQAALEAGSRFLSIARGKTIHIVAHYDADGLCSSAILQEALTRKEIGFSFSHYQHLDGGTIDDIASEDADIFIFTDIGSTKAARIKERLKDKTVFILDHHACDVADRGDADSFSHINPYCHGITASNEISGAGVAYFFALGMDQSNRNLAGLGVLGAIGDTQERDGFKELNNEILQHAILQKKVRVGRRLKLYGINSRPLVKVLEYSTDLDIPGVTNNPDGVKELLSELRIRHSFPNGKLKKYFHLHPEQQQRLTEKILDIKGEDALEGAIVPAYTFIDESKREMQDLRECATVINACGRLEEYGVAIGALRGDDLAKDKAVMNLKVYKGSLRDALNTIEKRKESGDVYQSDDLLVVDFGDQLKSSIVGVVASMTVRNKVVSEGVIVCTIADSDGDTVKISLRTGIDDPETRLDELLSAIVEEFGADAGGHPNAAGAVIPAEHKDAFIEKLKTSVE
ncbi:MAG: DHH family phosphoesterase [Candidatus Woesearchaeota archaeon]